MEGEINKRKLIVDYFKKWNVILSGSVLSFMLFGRFSTHVDMGSMTIHLLLMLVFISLSVTEFIEKNRRSGMMFVFIAAIYMFTSLIV